MKRYSCRQCRTGWVPGQVKTFDPDCPGCNQKKADGLRTGHEPLPVSQALNRRPKLDQAQFERNGKRYQASRAARKANCMRITAPREAA